MTGTRTPSLVQGTVIDTSRGTIILMALCLGLLGFAAGFVLWDTWSHKDGEYILPFHLSKHSLFTSYTVGLCMVGGVGCFIVLLFKSVFTQQVILGEEVLQVTRPSALGTTVETQVPYANIAAVTCEQEPYGFSQLRVGIDLHSLEAPGTYFCDYDFGSKEDGERDFYLPGFLTASPEEIARLLVERCRQKDVSSAE